MSDKNRFLPALFLCLLLCACLMPAAFADGNVSGHTPAALQNAVNSGATTFTLDADMTIPAGTQIDAPGLCLVIPAGKTLTVKDYLYVSALKLTGGNLNLKDGYRFTARESFTYQSGKVNIYGGSNSGFARADIVSKLDTIFTFPENSGNTNLLFFVNNIDELGSVGNTTAAFSNSNRFHAVVNVDFDWTLDQSTSIHENMSVMVRRHFTLAQGCTLQMPEVGNFIVDYGAAADIYGTIQGSGMIINPYGLVRLYGRINCGRLTLNGVFNTYDGCSFYLWDQMYGLNNGVPNGVLHVSDQSNITLNARNLNYARLPDWTVFHGNSGRVLLHFDAQNDDEFTEALDVSAELPDRFAGSIKLNYPCTIHENLSLTDCHVAELEVGRIGSLEIPAGKRLQADKVMIRGTTMTVNGTFTNTGVVQMYNDGGNDPLFTVASGGKVNGPGWFRIGNNYNNGNPAGCVQGITLTKGANYGESSIFYSQSGIFESLKQACAGEVQVGYVYYEGLGDFELPESITIPASLSVELRGTRLNIPSGVTLTIEGEISTEALYIHSGGSVVVQGGHLDVPNFSENGFIIYGPLTVNDGGVDTGAAHWLEYWSSSEKNRISLNGDSALSVHFEVYTEGAEDAIAAASTVRADKVRPVVELRYAFEQSEDLTIPENVIVRTYKSFVVPAGRTLTVNGILRGMSISVIDVFGTLVNDGFIDFWRRDDAADVPHLVMENGSVYRGDGDLGIMDFNDPDGYFSGLNLSGFIKSVDDIGTRYTPIHADLLLPAGLTAIEEEAFANGAFASVLIPAGVTSIDDTAFSGMNGLKIYGVSGTEAERFANAHAAQGFTFVAIG